MKKQQFEVLVGNLTKARQLKRRIHQLKHYRMNGITKLEGLYFIIIKYYAKAKEFQGLYLNIVF